MRIVDRYVFNAIPGDDFFEIKPTMNDPADKTLQVCFTKTGVKFNSVTNGVTKEIWTLNP